MFAQVRSGSSLLRNISLVAAVAASCLMAAPAQASSVSYKTYLQCRHTKLVDFPGTIVEAAVATPQLSTLVTLVKAAGLVDALSGAGPFTVFAPTDEAFGKTPAPLLNLIGGSPELLTSVLTYHVTSGSADPRQTLSPRQVKTLQGQTLFIGYDTDGASVNQSVASCTGVKTRNGTVWLIDSVLLPQFK